MYVAKLLFKIYCEAKGSITIVALLQIIDRLPLTLETLKASKLGKLVVKLVKDPPSPGELTFPFIRPPPVIRPGQTVSGYTIARFERKMRLRFSHQRYTYVLRPFCLDNENLIEYMYLTFRLRSFFGSFTKRSCQGHGIEHRTEMAPTRFECRRDVERLQ